MVVNILEVTDIAWSTIHGSLCLVIVLLFTVLIIFIRRFVRFFIYTFQYAINNANKNKSQKYSEAFQHRPKTAQKSMKNLGISRHRPKNTCYFYPVVDIFDTKRPDFRKILCPVGTNA